MLYSLSTQVIADTVHALVALELLSAPAGKKTLLAPLLDPARGGVLALMISNAFAETVLDLLPWVDDAELDGERPDTAPLPQTSVDGGDHLLRVALRVPSSGSAGEGRKGIHGIIRRHLENLVVLRVIHTALLAGGTAEGAEAAASFASKIRERISALTTLLRTPAVPFIRPRFF